MAMTALGGHVYIPSADTNWVNAGTTFTYDASTDAMAIMFLIPATGTISNVHFRTGATITSPVMTHRIELRTVSATTGLPDAAGTLYGSSTTITKDASTYTANTNVTAAVNATGATAGDLCALVFDLSAFTSGSFNQIQRWALPTTSDQFPYQLTNTAASDVLAVNNVTAFALEYGTDTYYPIAGVEALCSGLRVTQTVSNSGTTRRGNRYRAAVDQRAIGIWANLDADGDCLLRLRQQSDDSLLATASIDANVRASAAGGLFRLLFDSGATVNLTAATDYYVLVEGNSATSTTIYQITAVENAQLGQLGGGATCYGTSYAGSYTDANTTRYSIGLIVDAVDIGSGGGGGMLVHPGMSGGLRG